MQSLGFVGKEIKDFRETQRAKVSECKELCSGGSNKGQNSTIKRETETFPLHFKDFEFVNSSNQLPFFIEEEIPNCKTKFIALCNQLKEVQERIKAPTTLNTDRKGLTTMVDTLEEKMKEDISKLYLRKVLWKNYCTKKCKFYAAGFCLHGANCTFIH